MVPYRCIARHVECEGYPDISELRPVGRYAATASADGWEVVTAGMMATGVTRGSEGVRRDSEGNLTGSTSSSISLSHREEEKDGRDREGNSTGSTWSSVSLSSQEERNGYDHNYDCPNNFGGIVSRSYTSTSINSWTEILSPYSTAEQRLAVDVWWDLAVRLSRSQQGLTYWTVSLPTIAWNHASVRNAMIATTIVFNSLRKKDSPADYATAQTNALGYANRCIRELVVAKVPPEAMIACSSFFWIFEMLLGNWTASMTHLAAGVRISKYTRLSTLSDPFMAQYIRSFVGDLPASINPVAIAGMSREAQKAQSEARHRYAQSIMRDALDRLDVFQIRLNLMQSARRDRAIQMVSRTAMDLDRMYQKWPVDMDVDNDEPVVVQRAIINHSPFIQVINDAEVFFQDHDMKHITEFETCFRPCIDHFAWLAVCSRLQHRQHMVEVWNVKRQALPLTNRLLPTTEIEDG